MLDLNTFGLIEWSGSASVAATLYTQRQEAEI